MRRGFRKLHIDGKVWEYKIGRQVIQVFSPEGVKFLTNQSVVTGMSWDALERGYWKGWFKGVTPSHVKIWIEKGCPEPTVPSLQNPVPLWLREMEIPSA